MPPWPPVIANHPQIAVAIAALFVAALSLLILSFRRDAMWRLAGRIGLFIALTAVLVSQGIEPYLPSGEPAPGATGQTGVYLLEILWWVALARSLVGIVDAFVIFERRPHESRLFQQLIAGLIYLGVLLAIVGNVFNVPVGALFATSGAVAIIAGLALQSTLADVFSGIAINLGRSYRIGDWIIIDGGIEGKIVEANWQAVHFLTASHDLAIIPNSVLAKAKLINVSYPDEAHVVTTAVRLEPTIPPSHFVDIALEVLASCNVILHDPAPNVAIKSLSASAIELELRYRIPNRSVVDDARNEVLDRVFRHAAAAGLKFAPAQGDVLPPAAGAEATQPMRTPERIIKNLPLFSSLGNEHMTLLAEKMKRTEYAAGEAVIERGAVSQTLAILQSGALALYHEVNGREHELVRLAPGDYFGEGGLLLGEPQHGTIRALTHAVVYEIKADDLAPVLRERLTLSQELGQALARRRAMQAADEAAGSGRAEHSAKRLADRIRELFQLDLSSSR
ncbi:Cyclic nucleotide-regulated small mechanosensitive ion channel [Methylocella tundrae]|uniref:Small-conductance mechanosensitive channel n=1 Tax=Methylocella tundrae TaxID=227605 RepID=A0A8B6LZ72_METTU|nr:Cyclic nucleotide-regulated small mechanosensitive ion channel [Methylocella tundrae]